MPAYEFPELKGERVVLRRLNVEADVQELYEASHGDNSYIWKYLLSPPFGTLEAYKQYLSNYAPDIAAYVVVDITTGAKIGHINFMNVVLDHKRLELGNIWYTPKFHRTYANTEAIYLCLKYSFETIKQRRVEWKCDNRNEPSKNAATGLGFKYEGLFRKHMLVKGENRDTAWFSITDDEWGHVKQALEAKLQKYSK